MDTFHESLIQFLKTLDLPIDFNSYSNCQDLLDALYELDDPRVEDWLIGNQPRYLAEIQASLDYYRSLFTLIDGAS